MKRRPSRARSSYTKGILLLVGLVLAFYVYHKVSKEGIPTQFVDMFGEPTIDLRSVKKFQEAQQDSVRKALAGFWTYRSERGGPDMPMAVDDRIELKDNGITWRVRTETLFLPSGDSARLTQISHAFLVPFGITDPKTQLVISEVHFIGLIWAHGTDTCYVPVHKKIPDFDSFAWTRVASRSWLHRRSDEALELFGSLYKPYDGADKTRFFPEKSIGLIDSINVRQCLPGLTKAQLVREALLSDVRKVTVARRTVEDVRRIVKDYYVPYCLKPLVAERAGEELAVQGKLALEFDVLWDGTVQKVKASSKELRFHETFKKAVADEVGAWRFPRLESQDEALHFTFVATP